MKPATVAEVMTADPLTVPETAPFKDIAGLLTGNGISAVGVVDKTGTLVGVVSEADLLPHLWADSPAARRFSWPARRLVRKATARTARDLMTSPAVTINVGDSLSTAASMFARGHVRRLFVLDQEKVVGVLSRRDLVVVFNRGDADLEREVQQDVLGTMLELGPDRVRVAVRAGVVTVLGRVERRSDIAPVTKLVSALPGVVAVENRLDFVWDDIA